MVTGTPSPGLAMGQDEWAFEQRLEVHLTVQALHECSGHKGFTLEQRWDGSRG